MRMAARPLKCLITGANTGLGFEVAKQLLLKGHHVILACRDLQKGHSAAHKLRQLLPSPSVTPPHSSSTPTASTAPPLTAPPHNQSSSSSSSGGGVSGSNGSDGSSEAAVSVVECDLSSFASVRRCAEVLQTRGPLLDVLVCNAAVIPSSHRRTVDGNDEQLQVNHLSHFLLVDLLLPSLIKAAEVRAAAAAAATGAGGGSAATGAAAGSAATGAAAGSAANAHAAATGAAGGALRQQSGTGTAAASQQDNQQQHSTDNIQGGQQQQQQQQRQEQQQQQQGLPASLPASSRVVVVGSLQHTRAPPDFTEDPWKLQELLSTAVDRQQQQQQQELPALAPMQLYALTKLCNLWFTRYLASHVLPGASGMVVANVVSPGFIPNTELSRHVAGNFLSKFFMKFIMPWAPFAVTLQEGAGRVVAVCVGEQEGRASGQFYSRRAAVPGSPAAQDDAKAAVCWRLSCAATGVSSAVFGGLRVQQ